MADQRIEYAMAYLDLSDAEWDALPHKVQERLMQLAEGKLPDGDYELAEGAAWFTVGNISVRLHRTDEGVVCDMYPRGREMENSLASTYAFFVEAKARGEVECSLCGKPCEAAAAHLHQGNWIGDECCWDERASLV